MSNMVVQTNVMAINSHRSLGLVGNAQARASARLSSGFRINSAADDAAGLAISEKMRGQIRGLDQASRNAQDGISLIQTAEGAMSIINDMVIRIRELTVQAANDTNAHDESGHQGTAATHNMAQSDRLQIQREINALLAEIDATAERTQFNTRHLINGALAGAAAGGNVSGELNAMDAAIAFAAFSTFRADIAAGIAEIWSDDSIGEAIGDLVGMGLSAEAATNLRQDLVNILTRFEAGVLGASSHAEATAAETAARLAIAHTVNRFIQANVANFVAADGSVEASFTALVDALTTESDITAFNTAFAADPVSAVANLDMFEESLSAALTTLNNVSLGDGDVWDLFSSGAAVGGGLWFQVGANMAQGVRLTIQAVDVTALDGVPASFTPQQPLENPTFNFAALRNNNLDMGAGIMREDGEDISDFLEAIDLALAHVAGERAHLGAMQNRLEFTIENLDIASENLSAANSRIRDADMALEMMRFTQSNVLQQAAISMLAQANQAPQSILQLLR